MLKLIFGVLLIANGLLFAYHRGALDDLIPDGREPGRVARQLNPERVRLYPAAGTAGNPTPGSARASDATVPAPAGNRAPSPASSPAPSGSPGAAGTSGSSEPSKSAPVSGASETRGAIVAAPASTAAAAASTATAPLAASAAAPTLLACLEIGNFSTVEAKRFEQQLARLVPARRIVRREVDEESSHMVLIPRKDGKDGADKRIVELRRQGIRDFYLIQDNSDARWGISLGLFRTPEAARAHLATVLNAGVSDARVVEHRVPLKRIAFQLKGLDAAARSNVEKLRIDASRQELRNC